MGTPHPPRKAALILGLLSSIPDLLHSAAERCAQEFGPIEITSDAVDFNFTQYYDAEMGTPIKRRFVSFSRLIEPDLLAELKLTSNAIEAEFAKSGGYSVPRPINLDPGYVTAGKLVLATTKDYSHRICLRDGIYAEVTLIYRGRQFEPLPWTYPDYRTEQYIRFFTEVRAAYLQKPESRVQEA